MLLPREAVEKNAIIQLIGIKWLLEGGVTFRLAVTILGSINLVFALLMIANIIFDAWPARVRDLSVDVHRSRLTLHPAEIFPFVISIVVVIQGSIFIGIQSASLGRVTSRDCRTTAQVVWPALWIVSYTMLVFGIETTFRSLQRARFHPRGKWNIPLCVVAVPFLTLLTWTPSNFDKSKGQCLASLIWWTASYAKLGIVIAASLIVTYSVCALVITLQLLKRIETDRDERIAATRVVYYLVPSIILLALILPYYISIAAHRPAIRISEIAEVALNLFGIINGVLHVFLRSNADRSAIRAITTPWSQKRRLRIFGPSDLDMKMHISSPILFRKSFNEKADEDYQLTAQSGRSPDVSPKRLNSSRTRLQYLDFTIEPPVPRINPITQPIRLVSSQPMTQNRSNYSIYPTSASAMVRTSTSTTMSQGTDLPVQPPPPLSRVRERGFSAQSSATVQIGLRLSYLQRALDPIEREPASPSLHLPLQLPYSSRPSSTGSSAVFTQPFDHDSVSSSQVFPIPPQRDRARMSDHASISRSDEHSIGWPIRETTMHGSTSDNSLLGKTKPLPPVPLTLRTPDPHSRALENNLPLHSRPF